jgi:hypothetical protein
MTHLATPSGTVRAQWHGKPPTDAKFLNYGRLFNPNTGKDQMVHIWHSPSLGYGYED